jgi:hypothetical protein
MLCMFCGSDCKTNKEYKEVMKGRQLHQHIDLLFYLNLFYK